MRLIPILLLAILVGCVGKPGDYISQETQEKRIFVLWFGRDPLGLNKNSGLSDEEKMHKHIRYGMFPEMDIEGKCQGCQKRMRDMKLEKQGRLPFCTGTVDRHRPWIEILTPNGDRCYADSNSLGIFCH